MISLRQAYRRLKKMQSRLLNGRPILVLMYHRIDTHSESPLQKLTVSPDSFARQVDYLSQNYDILSLEDDWSRGGRPGIVLTFDDGYADSIFYALPVMERFHAPATFFITTENLGTGKEFWWDRLAFDFNACGSEFILPGEDAKVFKRDFPYGRLSEILAKFTNPDRERWLSHFETTNGIQFSNRKNYITLDHKQLDTIALNPFVRIGLHTHTHPNLGKMTRNEQENELGLTVEKLALLVPEYCNYLALPYGSYNPDTIGISKNIGIDGVLLANDAASHQAGRQSGKISRIVMPDITGEALKKYLHQFH